MGIYYIAILYKYNHIIKTEREQQKESVLGGYLVVVICVVFSSRRTIIKQTKLYIYVGDI